MVLHCSTTGCSTIFIYHSKWKSVLCYEFTFRWKYDSYEIQRNLILTWILNLNVFKFDNSPIWLTFESLIFLSSKPYESTKYCNIFLLFIECLKLGILSVSKINQSAKGHFFVCPLFNELFK